MTAEKAEQPYSWEEILSFDRLKRAMTGKALDRIENIWKGNEPISAEQISEVINDEWQKVKQAARNSPAAREAFRKYLERTVSEEIDRLIQRDKAELESLGVTERSL
jgi:biopolymer transport protein ExbB/TolQ